MSNDILSTAIDTWQVFLREGQQYQNAATGKNGKPSRLSNTIRYNLFALSIEKNFMAILTQKNDLADNHTFSDMITSVERHLPIPLKLKEELIALEHVQSICNMNEYHREPPSDEDLMRMETATQLAGTFAKQTCGVH